MVFIQGCYPDEIKKADSIIGEWLKANGFSKQAENYDLFSFDIHVQTIERTLIDKVFALCDYMISNNLQKHSRHIYDIYQLLKKVELNNEFNLLVNRVREDRKYNSLCVSAQDGADIPSLLKRVIETECYKKDYETNTIMMLYAPCSYEEAITGLKVIVESGMFQENDECKKNTIYLSVPISTKIKSYKEYRIFKMPSKSNYNEYTYQIQNSFISINHSGRVFVFHLPKDYIIELKNIKINQYIKLTLKEFANEIIYNK